MSKRIFYILVLNLVLPSYAQTFDAQEVTQETLELRLQAMRLITRYDPLEGGGSYGDAAGNMAIGWQSFESIDPNSLNQSSQTEFDSIRQQYLPKLTLLRGLRYPLDFGLQYGSFMNGLGMIGTHLQYTWFDEFRWPSIAVRAHFSQLTGSPKQSMQETGVSVFASYGPFYWLQAYLGFGIDQARYRIKLAETSVESSPVIEVRHNGRETSQHLYYGLRGKFGSSPYSLSLGENMVLVHSDKSAKASRSLQFKAAYGF